MSTLPAEWFRRYDDSDDDRFYDVPRLVTHIDDTAIAAVTQLYRDYFPPEGALLDLMSSWVSHLPPEVAYRRVAGLGMNRAELEANPRLSEWRVQNLNREQKLPYGDAEFDGAAICVSVQYLTNPADVFREAGRVLRPDAPLVVTFSNRCFPTKAVAAWQELDDAGHIALVQRYFEAAGNWRDVEALNRSSRRGDPLYAVIGRK